VPERSEGGVGHTEQFMPVRLASAVEPGHILDLTMVGTTAGTSWLPKQY